MENGLKEALHTVAEAKISESFEETDTDLPELGGMRDGLGVGESEGGHFM